MFSVVQCCCISQKENFGENLILSWFSVIPGIQTVRPHETLWQHVSTENQNIVPQTKIVGKVLHLNIWPNWKIMNFFMQHLFKVIYVSLFL